jgi:hypothetical protein
MMGWGWIDRGGMVDFGVVGRRGFAGRVDRVVRGQLGELVEAMDQVCIVMVRWREVEEHLNYLSYHYSEVFDLSHYFDY